MEVAERSNNLSFSKSFSVVGGYLVFLRGLISTTRPFQGVYGPRLFQDIDGKPHAANQRLGSGVYLVAIRGNPIPRDGVHRR